MSQTERNPTKVAACGCPYDPEYDAGSLGWHLRENHPEVPDTDPPANTTKETTMSEKSPKIWPKTEQAVEAAERLAPKQMDVIDREQLRRTMDIVYGERDDWDSRWDNEIASLDDLHLLYHLLQRTTMDLLHYRRELARVQRRGSDPVAAAFREESEQMAEAFRAQLEELPEAHR